VELFGEQFFAALPQFVAMIVGGVTVA